VNGVRHFMRNFTATAVKEHLRSQVEGTDGVPKLTDKEIELVRYVRDDSVKWDTMVVTERSKYP
jgi:hypothetical protein